jgi:hypothetical protein
VKKKHFIFIIQNNNKNKKHIKIKNKKDKSFQKKLKHEPSLRKPGDFIVLEGHGYPWCLSVWSSSLGCMLGGVLVGMCNLGEG